MVNYGRLYCRIPNLNAHCMTSISTCGVPRWAAWGRHCSNAAVAPRQARFFVDNSRGTANISFTSPTILRVLLSYSKLLLGRCENHLLWKIERAARTIPSRYEIRTSATPQTPLIESYSNHQYRDGGARGGLQLTTITRSRHPQGSSDPTALRTTISG
jgi:hypothetical protein